QAELHQSRIDADALVSAFPQGRLAELSDPVGRTRIGLAACRRRPLPVFLYADDIDALRAATGAIAGWSSEAELIVHLAGVAARSGLATAQALVSGRGTVAR